ncbi:nuclear speckle splicing regulatory protein 1 isoform X2 [Dendroctonus ponderosae]|uniref:Nuclear speckle splicing regulatory protein 1 N-terminal domain-containing protein n=2 Tax=Dendroctonus ponderosae TaxID=77166 RepID=A0AAR5Q955_DENPD|nr:nuclear speckle splicing regulatory protein 1 isoform X2 [Dendroctonus ponderosae]
MEKKKKESKLARKDIEKKPKYISKLLAAADRRKRENERRIERQVQKEREEEGEQFNDKESFITLSYKKKLEELQVLEEQEKREEYLESIGDVTKQGNLDGFYRHLYDQKLNYEDKEEELTTVKKEPLSDNEKSDQERTAIKRKSDSETDNGSHTNKSTAKKRKYRTRKASDSDNEKSDKEQEIVEVKKEHLPSNLDADSDFSVDSSDSEDEEANSKTKGLKKGTDANIECEGEKLQLPAKGNVLSDNAALAKNEGTDQPNENIKKDEPAIVKDEKPAKPKQNIWKKRTVGDLFEEAVKRYFERKSARGW